jgi:hypothetical protein
MMRKRNFGNMVIYRVKINVQVKCLDKIIFSEDFKNSEIDKTRYFAETARQWRKQTERIRDADANENFGIENVLDHR